MVSVKTVLARSFAVLFIASTLFVVPLVSHADESSSTTIRARVIEVLKTGEAMIPGTQIPTTTQTIKVEIVSEDGTKDTTVIENDYYNLNVGARVWINRNVSETGQITYAVFEPDRTPVLIAFGLLFLLVLFVFGGIQGVRGLASLLGSLVLIAFVLIPGLLKGYSPILVTIGVSSLITVVGSYITHGFNRTTTSAVLGMIATVIVSGILSLIAVHFGHLTGVTSEESVYLNFNTQGTLNMGGILLGGFIIGLLGVLYDAAIGQSIAIEELYRANPNLDRAHVFARGVRIGREHIGALVNTLAIAYVGASLPLLLLFASGNWESPLVTMNRELFSTELLRTFVGSIGLILAVPITTFIAVALLHGQKFGPATHHGHSHGSRVD